MLDNYIQVLKKYDDFSGRASRTEYWLFQLVNIGILFLGSLLFTLIDTLAMPLLMVVSIYLLVVFIPSLAVTVRRLHDTNKSGWFILISLLPYIGSLILLIFYVLDSTPGDNMYGPNPKGVTTDDSQTKQAIDDEEEIIEVEEIETES